MDDRDFEAQLSARIHRRFDGLAPSPELLAGVDQVLATKPRPIGLAGIRAGRREVGWGALLAAGIVAALAVTTGALGVFPNFGAKPTATPGPTFIASDQRFFLVVPPTAELPSKADSTLAHDVLSLRLQALGFDNFTSSVGNAIEFALPAGGPSDREIADTLSATGDVAFVPLPIERYGTAAEIGEQVATVGQPLPTEEPALFGWDGIRTIVADTNQQGFSVLQVTLRPAAAAAFGDYTAAHIGEFFAILIDGRVVSAPSINEEIRGGVMQVSAGDLDGQMNAAMAILLGGEQPRAWADPVVPDLKSQEEAIQEALVSNAGGAAATVQSADLQVTASDDGWQLAWVVVLQKPDGIMQVITPAVRGQ